jgi:hypothetical protein
MRQTFALLAVAALAACGKSDNDPGPGGVTVGEARALDEAAQMLEQRRMPTEALYPAASPSPTPAPIASNAP